MRLERIGSWCYRHRRRVVVLWIVLVIAILGASRAAGGHFADQRGLPGTQSQNAYDILNSKFPQAAGDSADIVFESRSGIEDPLVRSTMQPTFERIGHLPHVASVQSPYQLGGARLVAPGQRIAYAQVTFDHQTSQVPKSAVTRVVDTARAAGRPGLDVEAGGSIVSNAVSTGPGGSEGIGLLAAIVILIVSFGSLLAMGLPIVTALFGIGTGLGLLALMTHVVTAPTFAPEMAAMIGIGVGIDYALFVVTRYREGLRSGFDPQRAVAHSMATAGRAVLFAGCTLIISLLGMFVMGLPFVRGLAVGTIGAVLTVMLAALTLLPAILGFVGTNIDRARIPGFRPVGVTRGATVWEKWSQTVQRKPKLAAAGALLVLIVLAVPLLSMRLGFTDTGNDPAKTTSRQAYDLLAAGFGPGFNGPLLIAAEFPVASDLQVVNGVVSGLRSEPGVAQVSPAIPNAAGDAALVQVIPTASPQDAAVPPLVDRLRAKIGRDLHGTGITAAVGGQAAASVDFTKRITDRLPWLILTVVGLSFLLLMTVFRSLGIALTAAVMNLFSIAPAYGVIVAIFQWGWLGGIVGIGKTGPIDPWVPLMLFTILFGLSMDYEVFLLSRIREEWLRTRRNATAVANGLANTGRVITAAAAIMVCVFASFVLGDMRVLKLFGLGLAAAVLIDATVVRMLLVPATMEILDTANWWLPRWLDRILPAVKIEPPGGGARTTSLGDSAVAAAVTAGSPADPSTHPTSTSTQG